MKVVLHAAAVHHMSRASHRLQRTQEGVVAEGELVGAANVATLCMKSLGMVISPARLAMLVSHAARLVADLVPRCWTNVPVVPVRSRTNVLVALQVRQSRRLARHD
jgi:hypothetical protein